MLLASKESEKSREYSCFYGMGSPTPLHSPPCDELNWRDDDDDDDDDVDGYDPREKVIKLINFKRQRKNNKDV